MRHDCSFKKESTIVLRIICICEIVSTQLFNTSKCRLQKIVDIISNQILPVPRLTVMAHEMLDEMRLLITSFYMINFTC